MFHMVTKEEFGQLIAEFESFRDLTLEEISKIDSEIESLKEMVSDIVKETKISIDKKIG